MTALDRLASARGQRTQDANVAVAQACLADPATLAEIVAGLGGKEPRRVGDCAEVMTKVGEQAPALLVPHAPTLLALLDHRNGRVRWEAAHALALVAALVPPVIARALPRLATIAREDASVIVRDYVLDALGAWATTSARAATAALPVLVDALDTWHGKHAARVLRSLAAIAVAAPARKAELAPHAARFATHHRPGVRKAARALATAAT